MKPEDDLMRRCAAGLPEAFADLYEAYRDHLYKYALTLTGNPADAEDAVHDAILKAMTAAAGYRVSGSVAGWLRQILHNTVVDRQRRAATAERLAPALAPPPVPDHAGSVAARLDARAEISRLLLQLPVRQRRAIFALAVNDGSYAQASADLGISPGTLKSGAARARGLLRQLARTPNRGLRCGRHAGGLPSAHGGPGSGPAAAPAPGFPRADDGGPGLRGPRTGPAVRP